jgi:hypothetical protein
MVLGYINGPTEGLLAVSGIFLVLAGYGAAGEAMFASPVAPVRAARRLLLPARELTAGSTWRACRASARRWCRWRPRACR